MHTIDGHDIAKRLREAADMIETGDWVGLFAANNAVNIPAADLGYFCKEAARFGSAPSFADVLDWAKTFRSERTK